MAENLGLNFKIDINELQTGLKTANKLIRESESQFKAAAAGMDDWTKSEDGLKARISSLNTIVAQQRDKVRALKESYQNELAKGMDEASDRAIYLRTQINNEEAALAKNEKAVKDNEEALQKLKDGTDDAADAAEDASNGGFTVMKGVLANLATDVIRNCISALKDFGKAVVEIGIGFDQSMSQVAAVSGATGDELEKLRDKAKEMGSTTKFTASEAADAFNYMAMAGWKTEDMLGGIDGILNLAAASGTDLATTSDIVTDALTAMGYGAEDAGRLADVMAAASSNANTNVEMMGQTFQYAAPVVGALGYSMEDTAVAIGLMANAGIKGEKAGTALRSVMSRMAAPPKECADAMEALGIEIQNADGTMKPLSETLGDLRKAFDGMSEAEMAANAKHIAGTEAMSGLLAMVNASSEDFEKLTKAVEGANGAAGEMADTMLDNLGGDITILKSAFEGLQLTLFETANGPMRDVVQQVTNGIIPALNDLIAGVDGADAQLGEAISTLLNGIISSVIDFLPQIANVAVTLVIQLALGLVSALPQLVTAVSTIVTGVILSLSGALPDIVNAVITVVPLIVTALVAAIPQLLDAAITLLLAIVDAIPTIVEQLVIALPQIISTLINFLLANNFVVLDAAIKLFMALVKAIPQILPSLIMAIPSIIAGIVDGLIDGIPEMIKAGKELLSGLFKGMLDPQAIWKSVKKLFNNIMDNLKSLFDIHSPSRVMENIIGKNLALGIGKGFEDNIKGVNDEITNALNFESPTVNVVGRARAGAGAGAGKTINVYQTNHYSQEKSRYELWQAKQDVVAAVRLVEGGVT